MKLPNLKSRIPDSGTLRASAVLSAGKGVAFLASFAVITVMGRFVPREVAGSYQYVLAVLSVISLCTLPGMNAALVGAVARDHDGTIGPVMRERLSWGLMGTVLALIMGIWSLLQGATAVGISFCIAAPFVPLTDTFSSSAFAFWQGKRRFGIMTLVTIVYFVGIAIFTIPALILSDRLPIIVLAAMSGQTVMGLAAYALARRTSPSVDLESVSLGKHLTLMQALQVFATNADRILVTALFGPAATAVYAFAATPISKAWQAIPIGPVALPDLSRKTWGRDTKGLVMKRTLSWFVITVPGSLLLIAAAPWLYRVFFPTYPDAVGIFQVLALTVAFSPLMLVKSALTAFHRTRELYASEFIVPVIKIGSMLGFGLLWGMYGLAAGILLATISECVLLCALFLRIPAKQ